MHMLARFRHNKSGLRNQQLAPSLLKRVKLGISFATLRICAAFLLAIGPSSFARPKQYRYVHNGGLYTKVSHCIGGICIGFLMLDKSLPVLVDDTSCAIIAKILAKIGF